MTTAAVRTPPQTGLSHPFPEPPAPGESIEVAPGLRWVRMPLPFKLDHINLWLVEDDDGWAIVDAGYGIDETRALWDRVFETSLDGRPVTRVIVTHFHPDHMGLAAWLTERWGVELWCSQAEWLTAQLVWQGLGMNDIEKRLAHYRRNGVPEEAIERFRKRGNPYRRGVPNVVIQYRCLHDGDSIAIGGRRWRIVTARGHAPEHVCLHCPEAGVLISGDQVLPRITTNVSVWPDQPFGNPLRLFLDSFAAFRAMPADTFVLPSHGLPFHGLHARLDYLDRHHEDRLQETVAALEEPKTAAEVIPVLFRRELDTHQLAFAIGESLAHLHYLEWQRRAERVVGEDGVHRFRRA